ncbi:MAG: alpha/beta hydrolase [Bacteroidia bacterium]
MTEQPHYQFLSSQEFTLPYIEFGSGPELLLAFHGFGRTSRDFLPFESLLGKQYTLIAFDFFYHGPHGLEPEDRLPPFTGAQLARMIEKLLWEKKKVRCSIIGYSQGGRIALGQVHHLPHRIHELFIIAPDGLRNNKVRDFVGRTWIGHLLGRLFVQFPVLITATLQILKIAGKLNTKQVNFYLHQTREKRDRYRIFHTWIMLCKYNVHRDLIRHYIFKRPIRLDMVMGKYDAIIPSKWAQSFLKGFKGNFRLHLLECGHDVLQLKDEIAGIILENREK